MRGQVTFLASLFAVINAAGYLEKDGIFGMTEVMQLILEQRAECKLANACPLHLESVVTGENIPCVNGVVDAPNGDVYPCENIDLKAFISLEDLGSSHEADGNDIWGWTDQETGRLYAITGQTDGASIVDVTNPLNPDVLVFIPSEVPVNTIWRDMKVYKDTAYVVCDDRMNEHGMQVFDLTRVRDLQRQIEENPGFYNHKRLGDPVVMEPDYVYRGFGSSHNIVLNEKSGRAYAVGTRTCEGGLHIVDLTQNPLEPTFLGCYSSDGYTHDAEVITYNGPDSKYVGKEIAFAYNEDTLTIVDVSDPTNPQMISRTGYPTASYTHQGWCTEDHSFLLMDDELDELRLNVNDGHATTYIWDIRDLENPLNTGQFVQEFVSADHNQFISGSRTYQANYEAGLQILDISRIEEAILTRNGFFDVYPETNAVSFDGAWGVYPFFPGFVLVQSDIRGLFILEEKADSDRYSSK